MTALVVFGLVLAFVVYFVVVCVIVSKFPDNSWCTNGGEHCPFPGCITLGILILLGLTLCGITLVVIGMFFWRCIWVPCLDEIQRSQREAGIHEQLN
jgi:hypothetical protein